MFSNLRKASFKGISFGVFDAQDKMGRNTVVHEFPQNKSFVEDMGPANRVINLSAFLVGSDYQRRRNNLVRVLNSPGPGYLIHPWLGTISVSLAAPYEIAHSAQNGGMCTFNLQFVRDEGSLNLPNFKINLPQIANLEALITFKLSGLSLDNFFSEMPSNIIYCLPLAKNLVDFLFNLELENSKNPKTLGLFHQMETAIKAKFYQMVTEKNGLSKLLEPLWEIPDVILNNDLASKKTAQQFFELVTPSELKIKWGAMAEKNEKNSQNAFHQYQLEMATAAGLWALSATVPSSRLEAKKLKTMALKASEYCLERTKSDQVYIALQNLLATSLKALAKTTGSLPDLVSISELKALPSLVVVFRQVLRWGSGALEKTEKDLITRNQIEHPGFVPPHKIEVLRV